jgi:hypothetical protein
MQISLQPLHLTSFISSTKGCLKTTWSSGVPVFLERPEINAWFKAIKGYPDLQHLKKGISLVMQWIGAKHKQMQCFFVALLAGTLNVDDHALTVIHALTDFIYYAFSCTPQIH